MIHKMKNPTKDSIGVDVIKRPILGQRVASTDRVHRNCASDGKQTWKRFGDIAAFKPQPLSGIYVGYRTISNGHINYVYDGSVWVPSDYLEVWLIVATDRTNPVKVMPQDVSLQ